MADARLNNEGLGLWVPAFAGTTEENQFVLATRGGVGVVMNEVASSIATPR
jgi:hypothetical protein